MILAVFSDNPWVQAAVVLMVTVVAVSAMHAALESWRLWLIRREKK